MSSAQTKPTPKTNRRKQVIAPTLLPSALLNLFIQLSQPLRCKGGESSGNRLCHIRMVIMPEKTTL
jgi:hypothetical protein